jgi:hypothetical protein
VARRLGSEDEYEGADMGAVAWPTWFRDQMKRLMGLKYAPADLTTHWEALSDLGQDNVAAAVTKAQRQCDEFPSPRLLRSLAREPWSWRCPHLEQCGNPGACANADILGRARKSA